MTTMKFPIEKLASEFRTAIEMAKKEGEFEADFIFSRFPRGCCGDVSSLLGQYLLENNIKSNYVLWKWIFLRIKKKRHAITCLACSR